MRATYYFKYLYDHATKTHYTGRIAIEADNSLDAVNRVEYEIKKQHPERQNIRRIKKI